MATAALNLYKQWSKLFASYKGLLSFDPRWTVFVVLSSYIILGLTVLGFNRSPVQIGLTIFFAALFQYVLDGMVKGRWKQFPFSALITGMGLSILLNYGHSWHYTLIPVFFAIGTKYLFTYKSKHILNPALAGVVFALLFSSEL